MLENKIFMKEFGSDFHKCDIEFRGDSNILSSELGDIRYYASGRLALEALMIQERWTRIWIPSYFCYEVIEHIGNLGIKVELYGDNPIEINEEQILETLPFSDGDVLLRVNYFGLRTFRSNSRICIPVIEDHTHDIISHWAVNSDADWCIASLRKSLPIADGGIIWSPKKLNLPSQLKSTDTCNRMALTRYMAMDMKSEYLKNGGDKSLFRERFIQTETIIEEMELSGIDCFTKQILDYFDVRRWTAIRKYNWENIKKNIDDRVKLLIPSSRLLCNPFSVIIICDSKEERAAFRHYLISKSVYPAILWSIPDKVIHKDVKDISNRMLSIHCDARYSDDDIVQLCEVINSFYDKNY